MIFNKSANGSDELRALTGSYYANNDFAKIETDILLATEEVARIVGKPIIDKVELEYKSEAAPVELYASLIKYIQLPIAILATLNMYQKNDVSHEQDGRKVKINSETEKLPWEWQLKRDDEIQLNAYYKAVDRLIAFLEIKDPTEWKNSDQKKLANALFIKNAEMFDTYFPIERSGRMYMLLLPSIREAERRYIKPALSTDYALLKAATAPTDVQKELLEYVYPIIPLLAMSLAIRRLPLGLIPSGVIRNYVSSSQTMSASDPASLPDVKMLSSWLMDDAIILLEEMKRFRNATPVNYQLLPTNAATNKFMKV